MKKDSTLAVLILLGVTLLGATYLVNQETSLQLAPELNKPDLEGNSCIDWCNNNIERGSDAYRYCIRACDTANNYNWDTYCNSGGFRHYCEDECEQYGHGQDCVEACVDDCNYECSQ